MRSSNRLYRTVLPRWGIHTSIPDKTHTYTEARVTMEGAVVKPPPPFFPLISCKGQKALDRNHHGNRLNGNRAKLAHYPSAPCCMLSPEHATVTAPYGKGDLG